MAGSLQIWGIDAAKLGFERGSVVVTDHEAGKWAIEELVGRGPNYSFLGGNWTLSVDARGGTVVESPIVRWGDSPWWLSPGVEPTGRAADAWGDDIDRVLVGRTIEWAGVGPCEEFGLLLTHPGQAAMWFVASEVWRIPGLVGCWDRVGKGDEGLAALRGATIVSVDRDESDVMLVLDRGSILAGSLPSLGRRGWFVAPDSGNLSPQLGTVAGHEDSKSLTHYFVPLSDSFRLVRPTPGVAPSLPLDVSAIEISGVPKIRVHAGDGRNRWLRADRFEGSMTLRGCWILWKTAGDSALFVRDTPDIGDDEDPLLPLSEQISGRVLRCEVYPVNCLRLTLESGLTVWIDQPWRANIGNLDLDMESAEESVLCLEQKLAGAHIHSITLTPKALSLRFDGADSLVVYRVNGRDGLPSDWTFDRPPSEFEKG